MKVPERENWTAMQDLKRPRLKITMLLDDDKQKRKNNAKKAGVAINYYIRDSYP